MLVLETTNSGMGTGVSSAMARALGAGRRDRADDLVFHAFVLALALAAIFSAAMLLGAPFMFRWMGGRDEMLADALSYANVALGGAIVRLNFRVVMMRWELFADIPEGWRPRIRQYCDHQPLCRGPDLNTFCSLSHLDLVRQSSQWWGRIGVRANMAARATSRGSVRSQSLWCAAR
jgi:hypothetical protein